MSTNATEKQVVDIEARAQAKLSLLREHADRLAAFIEGDCFDRILLDFAGPADVMIDHKFPPAPSALKARELVGAYREAFPATAAGRRSAVDAEKKEEA